MMDPSQAQMLGGAPMDPNGGQQMQQMPQQYMQPQQPMMAQNP